MTTLIKNGVVITADPQDRVFLKGWVLLRDDRIEALGEGCPDAALRADRVVDSGADRRRGPRARLLYRAPSYGGRGKEPVRVRAAAGPFFSRRRSGKTEGRSQKSSFCLAIRALPLPPRRGEPFKSPKNRGRPPLPYL